MSFLLQVVIELIAYLGIRGFRDSSQTFDGDWVVK